MVTVRLFGAARAAVGKPELRMSAATLGELKSQLGQEFVELNQVLVKCSYLVNEVSCRDDAQSLMSGDTVDVLPPFAGGRA